MAYVISGTAHLHKTHVSRVAANICDPEPAVSGKVFDIDCSLVCVLGEPFLSGTVNFSRLRTHPDLCNGSRVGIRWIDSIGMVSFGCPPDYEEDNPNNNTWTGSSITTHNQGRPWDNEFPTPESPRMPYDYGPDFSVVIKTDVVMTAISRGVVSVTITTSKLMPGSDNTYFTCGTVTLTCFETAASLANNGVGARTYKSEITPASYDGDECGGDLKYIEAEVYLYSYDFGCSVENNDFGDKCNLKSGNKSYSCLVCLVTPSVPLAWNPYVIQLGVNPFACFDQGILCGCFKWQGNTMNPAPYQNSFDPMFFVNVGCPNETPFASKSQLIQYGYSTEWPSGDQLHIILKTVENGPICVAAKTFTAGPTPPPGVPATTIESPWIIGDITVIQPVSPFIMQASFSGLLPGDPILQFYGMEFPTAAIEDCQLNTFQEKAVSEEVKKEVPMPVPIKQDEKTIQESDPNMIRVKEMIKKIQLVKSKPCVSLGMALEKTPSCGCGGGILHECKRHGTCRQAGNDPKVQLCWKCSDYSNE
jgi:hypothetical protein